MMNRSKKFLQFLTYIIQTLCIVLIVFYFFIPVYAEKKADFTLNETKKNMMVGDKIKLTANFTDDVQYEVTWKSSNSKIASVNKKGVVKAKKYGTVKIIASINGTTYHAECKIKITKNPKALVKYSDAGIEFDYPSNFNLKKSSGEDGSQKKFLDKDGNLIFWYEQGEKWRVDLEQDQGAYKKQLEEKYNNVRLDRYTVKNINGINMLEIVFHISDKKKDQKIVEYLMVSEYAFFDFYFIDPEDDLVNQLIRSIHFVNN